MPLARDERERDDTRDVHLWAEDVHVEVELLADGLDVLETFLVVGSSTADPDGDAVLDEERSDLAEGANDTFECRCDLDGKVRLAREFLQIAVRRKVDKVFAE